MNEQMTAEEIIYALDIRRFTLRAEGDALFVSPREKLSAHDIEIIKKSKSVIITYLNSLPLPYLVNGELRTPIDCPKRYRWWAGGQDIWQTLLELNAPPETMRLYKRQ